MVELTEFASATKRSNDCANVVARMHEISSGGVAQEYRKLARRYYFLSLSRPEREDVSSDAEAARYPKKGRDEEERERERESGTLARC